MDWDNWWAMEYSAGPSCDLKYLDEVFLYYRALEEQNYAVDMIGTEDCLKDYEVVIAPLLYMTKGDVDEKRRCFVKEGGTFITTYFSGYVNENDLVILGGYPGKLRDILGIWVEESDALPRDKANGFIYDGRVYPASLLCDIIHSEGAQILARYEEDFYADTPVLTVNSFGKGKAYYVGTRSNEKFYRNFLSACMEEKGIFPVLEAEEGIEATERFKDGKGILFVLNHTEKPAYFQLKEQRRELLTKEMYKAGQEIEISAKGVMLLKNE